MEYIVHRWRCRTCEIIFAENDLLKAPNPFDTEEIINGCPRCKSVSKLDAICDEPDCEELNEYTCYTTNPSDEWSEYRNYCYEHIKSET